MAIAALTAAQYVSFNAFFGALGMSFDMWDSERERGISRDAWRQLLPFAERYRSLDDLRTFDATQSVYNVLIDDFVENIINAT